MDLFFNKPKSIGLWGNRSWTARQQCVPWRFAAIHAAMPIVRGGDTV